MILSLGAFGGLMVCVALAGLGEYRKLFSTHPREAMSLEVLLQLIFHPASTPALVSGLLLFVGLWFIAIPILAIFAASAYFLWDVATPAIWRVIVSHVPLLGSGYGR